MLPQAPVMSTVRGSSSIDSQERFIFGHRVRRRRIVVVVVVVIERLRRLSGS